MKKDNNAYKILIVDDEPLIRESLYEILRIEGYRAHMAPSAEHAIEFLQHTPVDIIVTDMRLPKISGLELITRVKEDYPSTEIIVITGFGTIENAVEAMRYGATDYITKPINDQEIKIIIKKIIEQKEIIQENQNLRKIIDETNRSSFCTMIGINEKMQKVYRIIESVAGTNATILITGESGTGKGLVAKAIHESDADRKDKPFVEVSCGALSETLLESELFGHMKGAFTGAIKDKEGRFEFAKSGTIFLDEIDAFSPNLQVKLLRVLQDGVFERVGDNQTRKTNARVIVATNQVLTDLVSRGEFREDLYYRINVISIKLPPLRERKEDIEFLVKHFMEIYNKRNRKKVTEVSKEVLASFMNYFWPGNIRELENAIEGAVIMTKGSIINESDVPNFSKFSTPVSGSVSDDNSPNNNEKSLKKILEQPERDLIISVLEECNWNRNKAAASLGVNRTTLYNKMKKYNILSSRLRGK